MRGLHGSPLAELGRLLFGRRNASRFPHHYDHSTWTILKAGPRTTMLLDEHQRLELPQRVFWGVSGT
jgi:hypothetical protein